MYFKISKKAQNFFSDIINFEGAYAGEGNKSSNKFIQFDVYYCCALIGMVACQKEEDTSDLRDIIDRYPNNYKDCKARIAGLLVATEIKRLGINVQSTQIENMMLQYLSSNNTLLSDEGVRALNAYSLKGFILLQDYPLMGDKPTSKEEFLEAFEVALNHYAK